MYFVYGKVQTSLSTIYLCLAIQNFPKQQRSADLCQVRPSKLINGRKLSRIFMGTFRLPGKGPAFHDSPIPCKQIRLRECVLLRFRSCPLRKTCLSCGSVDWNMSLSLHSRQIAINRLSSVISQAKRQAQFQVIQVCYVKLRTFLCQELHSILCLIFLMC